MLSSLEKKMKLSIMDFFSRPDSQETAHLVTFTEEILNKKLHFLCNIQYYNPVIWNLIPLEKD